MYNPIVAILVAAENATEDPRDGKPRQNARNAASQIVRTGLETRSSTWAKKEGRPLSRANAYIILELDVREKRPQCQTQMMIKVKRIIAPSSPKMSRRICRTGCPTSLLTVASKSWIEKRRHRR